MPLSFCGWLPQAGVAPTPVTALLHAVAVVKSGAFAIIRITYFSFGADFVRGTWAQTVVMSFTIFTIVYGCSKALKETHLKRRLAYSTISNLSYILFGVTLMTPLGLVGAITHLVCLVNQGYPHVGIDFGAKGQAMIEPKMHDGSGRGGAELLSSPLALVYGVLNRAQALLYVLDRSSGHSLRDGFHRVPCQ